MLGFLSRYKPWLMFFICLFETYLEANDPSTTGRLLSDSVNQRLLNPIDARKVRPLVGQRKVAFVNEHSRHLRG